MPSVPIVDTHQMTFTAGATLVAYTRVKIDSSGEIVAAGLTDRAIGYLTERGSTSGALCTVRLVGIPFNARAHSAIAIGALLYSQAAGRVDDADGGSAIVAGVALTAAAAQDEIITVLKVDYVS